MQESTKHLLVNILFSKKIYIFFLIEFIVVNKCGDIFIEVGQDFKIKLRKKLSKNKTIIVTREVLLFYSLKAIYRSPWDKKQHYYSL